MSSSKKLRSEVVGLLRDAKSILPEDFHDRIDSVSKRFFEQRRQIDSELTRLREVEQLATKWKSEVNSLQQEAVKHSTDLKEALCNRRLAETELSKCQQGIAEDKRTIFESAADRLFSHLQWIGELAIECDQLGITRRNLSQQLSAEIAAAQTAWRSVQQCEAIALGGYLVQPNGRYDALFDGIAVIVRRHGTASQVTVEIMTEVEAYAQFPLTEHVSDTPSQQDRPHSRKPTSMRPTKLRKEDHQ